MLNNLIYSIKERVEQDSINSIKILKTDDNSFYSVDNELTLKLLDYKEIIEEEHYNNILGFKECLNKHQCSFIYDKVIKIIGKLCNEEIKRDILTDDSNKNKWISKYPQCVVYEDWEKWSYYVCGSLGIKFELVKQICDFTLELTRKIIPCNLLIYIQAYKKACEINIKLDLNKERCQTELKLLREEHNCDLKLDTYIELKKCNVSFDFIKEVYDCNLKLKFNADKEILLETSLNDYALSCIDPQNLEILSEIGENPSLTQEIILENYK